MYIVIRIYHNGQITIQFMIINMGMRLFISKITRQYFIFKIILVVPYKNELTTQTAGNENVKDPTNHEHEQSTKSNIIPQPTGNTHALSPKTQPDPCPE